MWDERLGMEMWDEEMRDEGWTWTWRDGAMRTVEAMVFWSLKFDRHIGVDRLWRNGVGGGSELGNRGDEWRGQAGKT